MEEQIFSIFPNEPFIDLTLYQFGMEQCPPLHSYGPTTRNHFLFHYVISGTGTLESTDANARTNTFQLFPGQGFLISPMQVTRYQADEQNPWKYVWIEFDGLRVKETLEISGLSVDTPIYESNSRCLSEELMSELIYIAVHSKESPLHLIGHLYLALDILNRSSKNRRELSRRRMKDYYIKEALSFIEQNFQNNITVQDIADNCSLNRSYFSNIFRSILSQSPQEFLIQYRMAKAAELLKLTKLPIHDISTAVGYPNQLHFSRAFKKTYLVSPRQWRIDNQLSSL